MILLTILTGAGLGVLITSYRSYENTPSPYAVPLPPVPATPRISDRVIVVVSDGLRYDAVVDLPEMAKLAKQPDASLHQARTGIPSLSEPGWTAIMTGAGPVISGVRTNGYKGSPVPVESLFQTAKSQGMKTALAGAAEEWEQLFRSQPDEVYVAPFPYGKGADGDRESDPLVRRALNGPADLMLLYFPAVDESSHEFGAISDEGIKAMRLFDQRVGLIAAGLDFSRDTLIVTSDHGHLNQGGHGGYEELARQSPLLMVGKGIRHSPVAEVGQVDIAPTVAALLGIPRPRDAEGVPLLDSLVTDAATRNIIGQVHDEALRRRLRANYSVISGRDAPNSSREVLDGEIEEVSWQRAVRESIDRMPTGVGILGILILALLLAGGLSWRGIAATAIAIAAICFGVASSGFTLSMSWFSTPGDQVLLLTSVIGGGLIAAVIGGVLLGFGRPHRGWRSGIEYAATLAVIAGFLCIPLMVYYGPITSWRLPDLRFSWGMFILPFIAVMTTVLAIPLTAGMATLGGMLGSSGSIREGRRGKGLEGDEGADGVTDDPDDLDPDDRPDPDDLDPDDPDGADNPDDLDPDPDDRRDKSLSTDP